MSLILHLLLPPGLPVLLVIDDTLERRLGPKIKYNRATAVLPSESPNPELTPRQGEILGMFADGLPYRGSVCRFAANWPSGDGSRTIFGRSGDVRLLYWHQRTDLSPTTAGDERRREVYRENKHTQEVNISQDDQD